VQTALEIKPRTAVLAKSGDAPPPQLAAGSLAPPPARPNPPRPSDPDPVAQITSNLSQHSQIPVNRADFAKEPFCFPKINPLSIADQKYLQNSPCFYVLIPEDKV